MNSVSGARHTGLLLNQNSATGASENSGDPQAAEKFKEISAAFEILNDKQSRHEYDTFGTTRRNSPFSQNKPFTSAFEDMFHQFFNEQRRSVQKGENINVQINVNLRQVFKE